MLVREAEMRRLSVWGMAGVMSLAATGGFAQTREIQQGDLLYQGSFTFENAKATCSAGTVDFAYVQGVIAYNPANRSLFVVGHDHCQHVAEFRVPEIGGVATVLQPFRDVAGGRLGEINPSDPGSKKIGGLMVIGDRLVASAYSYYDGGGTATSSHFVHSTNLSDPGAQGPFRVGSMNPGFYAGYFAPVPPEWQDRLGAVLNGQCCLSIISRTSFGPSVSSVNPTDLIAARNPTSATMLVGYPEGHLTLGDGTATGPVFNLTSTVRGVVLPKGTASVLFFGSHGLGRYCYGEVPAECDDPANANKGGHAYPYRPQVWAYRASDLAEVKAGRRRAWDVEPYATWRLPVLRDHRIGGVAVDEDSGRIFVLESYGDGERPRVHVFTIRNDSVDGRTDGGPCSYALAAGAESLSDGAALRLAAASTQAVLTVTPTDARCAWAAWSGADWLAVGPTDGVGFGQVVLTASANPLGSERVGYAHVAGWTFTVTQDTAGEQRRPAITIPRPLPRRP